MRRLFIQTVFFFLFWTIFKNIFVLHNKIKQCIIVKIILESKFINFLPRASFVDNAVFAASIVFKATSFLFVMRKSNKHGLEIEPVSLQNFTFVRKLLVFICCATNTSRNGGFETFEGL